MHATFMQDFDAPGEGGYFIALPAYDSQGILKAPEEPPEFGYTGVVFGIADFIGKYSNAV